MNEQIDVAFENRLNGFIDDCLKNDVFTGCSIGFSYVRNNVTQMSVFNYGKTGQHRLCSSVKDTSMFDVASLTKPLITSWLTLLLINEKQISFDDCIPKYYENVDNRKKTINIIHLLTHTSGFPAHRSYYSDLINMPIKERKSSIVKKILCEELNSLPGKTVTYSDLGFIVLGDVLEKTTGHDLDELWIRKIASQVKIDEKHMLFNKSKKTKIDFVCTGVCAWSGERLSGIVNDDNCRSIGGIAGHAGLFATSKGILLYLKIIMDELKGRTNVFNLTENTRKSFMVKSKRTTWINGFDTPSPGYTSAGKFFSDYSLGHLGFTGTSFWMDMKKECAVVILTNRVIYKESRQKIHTIRPLLHDMIMEYIAEKMLKN